MAVGRDAHSDGRGRAGARAPCPLEKDFPNQFEVLAGLGVVYYFRGDLARTVDYLERAIAVRPPNDGLLISLADSHERLGNSEKARQYFERSLELNPDHPGIRERLTGLKEDD